MSEFHKALSKALDKESDPMERVKVLTEHLTDLNREFKITSDLHERLGEYYRILTHAKDSMYVMRDVREVSQIEHREKVIKEAVMRAHDLVPEIERLIRKDISADHRLLK